MRCSTWWTLWMRFAVRVSWTMRCGLGGTTVWQYTCHILWLKNCYEVTSGGLSSVPQSFLVIGISKRQSSEELGHTLLMASISWSIDSRLWNGGVSCRERSLWISTRPVWILRRAPRQNQDAARVGMLSETRVRNCCVIWFDQSHSFENVGWSCMVLWYCLLRRQIHLWFRSLGCAKCTLGRKSFFSSTCFATIPVGSQHLASSFRPKLLDELRRRGEEGARPGENSD